MRNNEVERFAEYGDELFVGALEGQAFLETECYRCDEYSACGGRDIPSCMVKAGENKREIPKFSPVLGETVMTDDELETVLEDEIQTPDPFKPQIIRKSPRLLIAEAQDTHTREKMAEAIIAILKNPEYEDYDKFRALEHLVEDLEG